MHIYTLYKNSVPINLQVAFLHQSSGKTKIAAAMKHSRNELHPKSQIRHENKGENIKELDSPIKEDAGVKGKAIDLQGDAEKLFEIFQVETNKHQLALDRGTKILHNILVWICILNMRCHEAEKYKSFNICIFTVDSANPKLPGDARYVRPINQNLPPKRFPRGTGMFMLHHAYL